MIDADLTPTPKSKKLKWFFAVIGIILLLLFIFRFQLNALYCSTLPDKPTFLSTGQEQGECLLDLAIKSKTLTCFPFRETGECIPFNEYTPVSTSLIRFKWLYSYQSKTLEDCNLLSDEFDRLICNNNVQLLKIMQQASTSIEDCKKITDSGSQAYCIADLAVKKKDVSLCDTLSGEGFGNLRYDCIIYASFKTRSYLSCYKIDASDWRHNCKREVNIARCLIDNSFCLI